MSNRKDKLLRAKELKLELPGNVSNKDLDAALAAAEAKAASANTPSNDNGDGQKNAPDNGSGPALPEGGKPQDLPPSFDTEMFGETAANYAAVVQGPAEGRWRAKRYFTLEPVTIPMTELTPDDIVMLADDPLLALSFMHKGEPVSGEKAPD